MTKIKFKLTKIMLFIHTHCQEATPPVQDAMVIIVSITIWNLPQKKTPELSPEVRIRQNGFLQLLQKEYRKYISADSTRTFLFICKRKDNGPLMDDNNLKYRITTANTAKPNKNVHQNIIFVSQYYNDPSSLTNFWIKLLKIKSMKPALMN